VAIIYLAINLSIIGIATLERVRARGDHPESGFVVSVLMEKIYGPKIATPSSHGALDSVRFSLAPTAWLLANPLCSGAGRLLLQSFRPAAPTKHFPYVALIVDWCDFNNLQLLLA